MFKQRYVSILIILLSLGCGGGDDPGPGPNDNFDNEDPVDEQEQPQDTAANCDLTIDQVVADLYNTTPSWEQLDCYKPRLTRLASPTYIKRALLGVENISESPSAWTEHLAEVDEAWETYPLNTTNVLMGPLPPYTDTNDQLITYPLTETNLDLKLRSFIAVLIREKLDGRPAFFNHFWPPSVEQQVDTEQEYNDFMTNVFIPEKVYEAAKLEEYLIEYYTPFSLEVGVFMRGLGQWYEDLPENEQIVLAQAYIDQIHDAVRPLFTGTLVAHEYSRYALTGTAWYDLSFAEFDHINFALFPECDIETTETYVDEQLAGYLTIVARDSIPYMINELTVYQERYFDNLCPSTNFNEIEADLYTAIFNKLDAASIQPIGLSIYEDGIATAAARTVIINYWNSK